MLDACDRLGMLVMDELSDMWTRSKNNNDYSMNFQDYWEKDVELLVARIITILPSSYSMGNEIQEAGTAKGAELNRRINEKIKALTMPDIPPMLLMACWRSWIPWDRLCRIFWGENTGKR